MSKPKELARFLLFAAIGAAAAFLMSINNSYLATILGDKISRFEFILAGGFLGLFLYTIYYFCKIYEQKSGAEYKFGDKPFIVLIDLILKLAIPIVLLLVGSWMSAQQRNSELLAKFIEKLAHQDKSVRIIALNFVQFLDSKGEVPKELVEYAKTFNEEAETVEEAKLADKLAEQNAKVKGPEAVEKFKEQVNQKPARVFFHICRQEDRGKANEAIKFLDKITKKVQGVQYIKGCPEKTEIRYFRESEKSIAAEIWSDFLDNDIDNKMVEVKGYSSTVRPRTLEVWFSGDAFDKLKSQM